MYIECSVNILIFKVGKLMQTPLPQNFKLLVNPRETPCVYIRKIINLKCINETRYDS